MVGSSNIVADAVLIIGLSIAVSLVVLWLVRRVVTHDRLTPHNEVSGFVYAVIGVIYAVILGFVVISVWEQYREAESTSRMEADAVGDIYRLAEGLPDASRQPLQEAVVGYADAVIDVEWNAMRSGEAPHPAAVEQLDGIWAALYAVEVSSPEEEDIYASTLEEMNSLSEHRRERLEQSTSGLLSIMWWVMIGGGLLTVLFPCLFGVENGLVHALIIGTLAASIGLLLFVVYDLNRPYNGDVHVQPDALRLVLRQIDAIRQ